MNSMTLIALANISYNGADAIQLTSQTQQQVQSLSSTEARTNLQNHNSLQVGQKSHALLSANGQAEVEAKWGFLKNIVNIDTFFSSGADHTEGPKKNKKRTLAEHKDSKTKNFLDKKSKVSNKESKDIMRSFKTQKEDKPDTKNPLEEKPKVEEKASSEVKAATEEKTPKVEEKASTEVKAATEEKTPEEGKEPSSQVKAAGPSSDITALHEKEDISESEKNQDEKKSKKDKKSHKKSEKKENKKTEKKDDKEEDEIDNKAAETAVKDIEKEDEDQNMIEKKAAAKAVDEIEAEKGSDSGDTISQEEIEKKAAEMAVEQIEKEKKDDPTEDSRAEKKDTDAHKEPEAETKKEVDAPKEPEAETKKGVDAPKEPEPETKKEADAPKEPKPEVKKEKVIDPSELEDAHDNNTNTPQGEQVKKDIDNPMESQSPDDSGETPQQQLAQKDKKTKNKKKNKQKTEEGSFKEPVNFTILYAEDQFKDEDIKTESMKLDSTKEADDFFDKFDGQKILLANGQLFKTNIDNEKEESQMQYYKFIGEAYNSNQLDRAPMSEGKPGTSFYTYIIDGKPQSLAHSAKNDKLYGYSKQVINGKESPKLFSQSCKKLKYNRGNEQRQNECRLASGYQIVHEQKLFQQPITDFKKLGISLSQSKE